jgi:hypothetical protein
MAEKKKSTRRAGKKAAEPTGAVAEAQPTVPVAAAELAPPEVPAATVRDLAHALWKERGGNAFDNWIEAERRVSSGAASGTTP